MRRGMDHMPDTHSHARPCENGSRIARRNRRGLSALLATLLLALLLAAGFSAWAWAQALRLRDAQARALDQWARQEARALHLWLHDEQAKDDFILPGMGSARTAGNPSAGGGSGSLPTGLDDHRPPWLSPPAGFRARHVIANPRRQANNPGDDPALQRAQGILVVSVRDPSSGDGNDGYLLSVLCRSLASSNDAVIAAEGLAGQALSSADFGGPGCDTSDQSAGTDPGEAVAVFAAPLAGIDTDLVLRAPRSGFVPAAMETALDMGGHDILGVARLTTAGAGGLDADVLAPKGSGAIAVSGELTLEGSLGAVHLHAGSGEVSGDIVVQGQLVTGDQADSRLDVTDTLGQDSTTMTLSGPGPRPASRTLSVGECRPAGCRNAGGW